MKMKKKLLKFLLLISVATGSQSVYSQMSKNYRWTEKGARYTSFDIGFDLPQGLSDGYSSYDLSLNGYEGINIIKNLGIETGVGLAMNSLHTESTLESSSYYNYIKKNGYIRPQERRHLLQ
jgi:hypothetical protein